MDFGAMCARLRLPLCVMGIALCVRCPGGVQLLSRMRVVVGGRIYVHQDSWYAERAVELLLGRRVILLDRIAQQVELETGEWIGYSKLLLATGASPRRLRLPGGELDGVHYLRRIADSDRLRETIRAGGQIVVVGAG